MNYGQFTGFQTVHDATKINDGASPDGQNTSILEGDRVSTRPYGYEQFGNELTLSAGEEGSVTSLHTFRKRSAEQILMRGMNLSGDGASVQWYDEVTSTWQTLLSGQDVRTPFGYSDFNINALQQSLTFFCNGSDPMAAWNGAHASFASASTTPGYIGTIEPDTDIGTSSGYVSGDLVQINGGSGDATATVTSISNGAMGTNHLTDDTYAGASPGDVLWVGRPVGTTSPATATIMVDTTLGNQILTYHVLTRGANYAAGQSRLLVKTGSTPSGAVLMVDSAFNGHATTVAVTDNASGYSVGTATTTALTGSGIDLEIDILSVVDNTITANQGGSVDLADDNGFYGGGTLQVGDPSSPWGSVSYVYTGISGNTFYGVTPDPTAAGHVVDSPIYQSADTDASYPRGNILLTASNRLFVAGSQDDKSVVFFSEYGNPLLNGTATLVNQGTATSAGIFNLAEGGGQVTGMILQEGTIYIFKETIIYAAQLTDSFYSILPLKPADQQSSSAGALKYTVFTGGNRVFAVTADKQIIAVERVEQIDYPGLVPISYPIKPTVLGWEWRGSRGIVFNNKAFIAAKGSLGLDAQGTNFEPIVHNNRVLVYNTQLNAFDTPIVGWHPASWAIYNNGDSEDLYFGSSVEPNVKKVTGTALDGTFPVSASWKTKRLDFGLPAQRKWTPKFFLYGRILANTTLTVKVLFNEDGFTQTYTGEFSGTDTTKLFSLVGDNSFGTSEFGVSVFGGDEDTSGLRYFRIYFINKVRATPFYNIQMEFSSDGENQQWEILNHSWDVGLYENEEDRNLYSDFSPAIPQP